MESYIIIIVAVVGLAALFGIAGAGSLTGMAAQRHIFFSENICGAAGLVPVISKVAAPGRPHDFIYRCIPASEKIEVPTSGFYLKERQKAKRLTDIFYIYNNPPRE